MDATRMDNPARRGRPGIKVHQLQQALAETLYPTWSTCSASVNAKQHMLPLPWTSWSS